MCACGHACVRLGKILKKGRYDDLEIRVLDYQPAGLRFSIIGWLKVKLNHLSLQGRLNEYQDVWGFVVKIKMSPRSDSVALRQLNHIYEKGPKSLN